MSVVNYSFAPAAPAPPSTLYGPPGLPSPSYLYSATPASPPAVPPSVPARSSSRDPYRGYHPDYRKQPHREREVPHSRSRAPHYTRINTNSASSRGKTTLHAVVDYDDDLGDEDYYDDVEDVARKNVRGPIHAKNGSLPVVPLFSYPVLSNGSIVQIPILWTALSLALGLEIHGEIVRGMPCIKRFHQLFCPVAGNNYPLERIERFIDDNKSLMRRMYGEFQTVSEYGTPPSHEFFENGAAAAGSGVGVGGGGTKRRSVAKREAVASNGTVLTPPNAAAGAEPNIRLKRQSFQNNQTSETGRMDACESKVEVLTPYWATNSAGKVRAIVNTQHFEQAIHQEMCAKPQTKRCMGDCGCEQKYKWHRLLAYDPDNDCKGIFMDWFLFPACCVCRCAPMFNGQ